MADITVLGDTLAGMAAAARLAKAGHRVSLVRLDPAPQHEIPQVFTLSGPLARPVQE